MFGKLMKHEFRATGRAALPLCGVMLALAVIAGIVLRLWDDVGLSGWGETAGSLAIVLYGMSIFAVAIGIFVILMQHFKRNLLGDEGYLTRTLPVSLHELLLSKLFVALIWYFASGVLIVLSVLITGVLTGEFSEPGLGEILVAISRVVSEDPALIARAFLGWLGGMSFVTLLFYADFVLAQSFSKHKILYNIMGVVIIILLLRLVFGLNDLFYASINRLGAIGSTDGGSLGIIGGADGPTAIYVTGGSRWVELVELYLGNALLYFLTWGFLTKRPNLE